MLSTNKSTEWHTHLKELFIAIDVGYHASAYQVPLCDGLMVFKIAHNDEEQTTSQIYKRLVFFFMAKWDYRYK